MSITASSPRLASARLLLVPVGFVALAIGSATAQTIDQQQVSSLITSGPLTRAAAREVTRLADAGSLSANGRPGQSRRSEWSRVRDIEGEPILLTVTGLPRGKRYLLRGSVDEFGLTVLIPPGDTIPATVEDALVRTASTHPEYFDQAQQGASFTLNRHVRLGPDGVSLDGRRVGQISDFVERIDRNRVVEISRLHRATARGVKWGALTGGVLGAAVVFSQCGTNWSRETATCRNLTPLYLFVLPVYGLGIGSLVGATFQISTVVYRAPPL
jgi:hypothetical protein